MSGWCSFHLEVTATAGRAFAVSGHDTQASRAWRYVRERQDADGAWSGYWWTARQYPTLQAGALARLFGEPGPVKRAAQWVIREQRADGGWDTPEVETSAAASALSLLVLLLAGNGRKALQRGILRLVRLQLPDGSWPSCPLVRIPPPEVTEPATFARWRTDALGTGAIVRDQHRAFTTAMCVSALTRAVAATV
jgi:squalene-hopene/tetraprenyl-beta-curcumene cyclase